MSKNNKGLLIVLSGPSGCGKGTMVAELLKRGDCAVSVSATTRQPREGEIDGTHYYFLSKEEFQQRIDNDGLLEYAEYCGNYYGTPRAEVDRLRAEGKHVILEIEGGETRYGELKKKVASSVSAMLSDFQQKLSQISDDEVYALLGFGEDYANEVANKKLFEVQKAFNLR